MKKKRAIHREQRELKKRDIPNIDKKRSVCGGDRNKKANVI